MAAIVKNSLQPEPLVLTFSIPTTAFGWNHKFYLKDYITENQLKVFNTITKNPFIIQLHTSSAYANSQTEFYFSRWGEDTPDIILHPRGPEDPANTIIMEIKGWRPQSNPNGGAAALATNYVKCNVMFQAQDSYFTFNLEGEPNGSTGITGDTNSKITVTITENLEYI